jgi:malonate-semialdehyde dehydrogenase (acetylating)/methylmalonate-semialdehyde dehydrogenase
MTAQNGCINVQGCAGQRCMAASAMIGAGKCVDAIVTKKICDEARK